MTTVNENDILTLIIDDWPKMSLFASEEWYSDMTAGSIEPINCRQEQSVTNELAALF